MTTQPRIHLSIVQPAGYIHWMALLDQARYFRFQLKRLGAEVTMAKNRLRHDAVNLVFGAHLGFDPDLRNSHTCIFVNLEQLGVDGAPMAPSYLELLSTSGVIDYDAGNVPAYCCDPADVPLAPLQFAPYLTQGVEQIPLENRPIDLLFIGSMNDRRRTWLQRLETTGRSVTHFDAPLYGEERDHYIRQAKAVLNVHFYEACRFEQARASHCLSLGTPVISERTSLTTVPEAFEDSVLWIQDHEMEQFFRHDFGTPACLDAFRAGLERFRLLDPVEAYANVLAFVEGYSAIHRQQVRRKVWTPDRINLGSGKDYKAGWLNLDVLERTQPDLVLDLSDSNLALPLKAESEWGGHLMLNENTIELINANNVLEHVAALPALMSNCLRLLKVGGVMQIEVPYERAPSAWQDPTHLRAMNENSWVYYGDWFWYLGWYEHRFEMTQSCYLDGSLQPCLQERAHFMRVSLRKRVTTPNERMVAQAMQPEIRIPDDDSCSDHAARSRPASALLAPAHDFSVIAQAAVDSAVLAANHPAMHSQAASAVHPDQATAQAFSNVLPTPPSVVGANRDQPGIVADTKGRQRPYVFTNEWFNAQRPIVDRILAGFEAGNPIRILEIGSHEGRSTVHYLDHHMDHPDSIVVSIDPFSTDDSTTPLTESTKSIFEHNVSNSRFPDKSKLIVGYSQDVLCRLVSDNQEFDYIVIDGSHLAKDALLDACLSFQLLRPGGIMFFDDYLGGNEDRDSNPHWPKIGIDSFLRSYEGHYSVIHQDYHLGIRKCGEKPGSAQRRVIDCFLFNNELEMLKLRVNELRDVVDIFVLVESRFTFSGKPKPLHFDLHKEEFKDFNIVHFILDSAPDADPWANEAAQRNGPVAYLRSTMGPNDVALLCDLDEIPDPVTVQGIKGSTTFAPVYLEMDLFYYNFHWLKKCKWTRASAVDLATIQKFSIEQIRNHQAGIDGVARQAGWHLSYFLSPEQIRAKIMSFSHQEFNRTAFVDLNAIRSAIDTGTDLFHRGEEEDLLPWSGQPLPRFKGLVEGSTEQPREPRLAALEAHRMSPAALAD